ncbi:similar to Saccharomyces cerevisiae YDR498C SEC20 Membrane glycoprotein v-SNARE involved in retrograde transport from the Golgi to the ER [Maudiozyma barnettii]|uniref:Similar to Saccharomyces cerevisiae YDR498C SEC20 Membrane glycoprotein v-SNARE involved in retrograde transport from the Golgi to the ER n=1 Tax=Maudiozyma barnettii TaxID=61262 RepID=A0A8H2ZFM8_9SACH|nr:Sec20p [Kazachstania barnettii]CAB4253586.1 similar to Saccharomyces cerevisiae YDR498C SEC20 Membrane glycoprotein v-SNARE involved in retrograde transport from the Golgi to the ER [Kazachstania barnettii]CAD1781260.1 similar to Saccharomyces cerevisiae YDR498C SEC20 Membrane glycoprotein v-SNARE involved in retrograde transport from the Golgi to the ER [Kazachstania barnettii]
MQYVEELEQLKIRMLDELSKLSEDSLSDNASENDSQDINAECTKLVMQFESKLRSAIVVINQSNKTIKLTYIQSRSLDTLDTLKVVGDLQQCKNETCGLIQDIIMLTNWNYEYKERMRKMIKANYYQKLNEMDQLRNEAINAHTESKISTEKHRDTPTVDVQGTSTKAQVLTQTKKLSNNLIKGNQILQSSILQSSLNLDELKQQTSSLQTVDDKYDQFQLVVNKTSSLVKSLEKASNQEKRDVYLALFFLIACISWVVWRRILKMPVKLFLWMCFKFFKSILVAIGMVQSTISTTTTMKREDITSSHSSIIKEATQSLEQFVDEAMDRILSSHDEL